MVLERLEVAHHFGWDSCRINSGIASTWGTVVEADGFAGLFEFQVPMGRRSRWLPAVERACLPDSFEISKQRFRLCETAGPQGGGTALEGRLLWMKGLERLTASAEIPSAGAHYGTSSCALFWASGCERFEAAW